MSIADWFKAREEQKYTAVRNGDGADLPEGVWSKCPNCRHILYAGELDENLMVCPHCEHHFDIGARERIALLVDDGSFEETDSALSSCDPIRFTSSKPYAETLERAQERSGLAEAIVTGRATVGGHPAVVGAMDFRFVGASMGSAVGEKVARAFELAIAERRAIVLFTASGGARMQEGMLSLMQMAKTAAAAARLADAGLPYVAVLTNPTTGGVTASFATLADIIIAEPGALIGFAGPRLIEQATNQKLPKDFQTAEILVKHGMLDAVVPRAEMTDTVRRLLDYLVPVGSAGRG